MQHVHLGLSPIPMKRRAAHDSNCHDGRSRRPFDENGQEALDAIRTRGIEDYSQTDDIRQRRGLAS